MNCEYCGKPLLCKQFPSKPRRFCSRSCAALYGWHRPGGLGGKRAIVPLIERWMAKIQPLESGCWLWTGAISTDGYSLIAITRGHSTKAYRVAYEYFVGDIPSGLELDHLCRTRACVNPDHLEAVTKRENVLRGISPAAQFAKQTHCHRGHPFTPENTTSNGLGGRACRECRRIINRNYRARQRIRKAA